MGDSAGECAAAPPAPPQARPGVIHPPAPCHAAALGQPHCCLHGQGHAVPRTHLYHPARSGNPSRPGRAKKKKKKKKCAHRKRERKDLCDATSLSHRATAYTATQHTSGTPPPTLPHTRTCRTVAPFSASQSAAEAFPGQSGMASTTCTWTLKVALSMRYHKAHNVSVTLSQCHSVSVTLSHCQCHSVSVSVTASQCHMIQPGLRLVRAPGNRARLPSYTNQSYLGSEMRNEA